MAHEPAEIVRLPPKEPTPYELLKNCPSPLMQALCVRLGRVANAPSIIITGPSGAGKELVANALRSLGPRSGERFVAVNCGSLMPELFGSDFYGHVKGAFTGARDSRTGFFEEADKGTLFLDEVSEIPFVSQASLLRVLEGKPFRKVGGTEQVTVDVAIVAATNSSLGAMVGRKQFRPDLWHRLKMVQLTVPALRERPEDIKYLAEYFARRASYGTITISQKAMQLLLAHSWPGNVRELEYAIRAAMYFLEDSQAILPEHLELERAEFSDLDDITPVLHLGHQSLTSIGNRTKRSVEGLLMIETLRAAGGNKAEAARRLKIDYKTFRVNLRKFIEKES